MPQRLANVVVALRNAQRNVGTFSKILRHCRVRAYWQKYLPQPTQLTVNLSQSSLFMLHAGPNQRRP